MKMFNKIIHNVFKELVQLIKEIFNRSKWILFFSLFLFILVLKLLESIPYKIIPGTTDSWLSFWSTIFGSVISIVFTIFVMLYTIRTDENIRLAEKLPMIVPSNSTYSDLQIIEDGLPTNDLIYFTQKLYIDVYNLGLTGIFDIKGTVQVLDNISNKNLDVITKNDKIKINNKYFDPSSINEKKYFEFNRKLNLPSQQKSILLPGETIKIELPHEITLYLVALIALKKHSQINNNRNIESSPNIKINLKYKNYRNIYENIEFIVDLSTISIESIRNHGNYHSYWLNGIATINSINH